jgi:hypothetical protein
MFSVKSLVYYIWYGMTRFFQEKRDTAYKTI